ncbi:MAG: hypothetical protein WBF77_01765 [Sulfurimonadaceae bacterium]
MHIIYDDTTPSKRAEYAKKPVFEHSTSTEKEQEKENIKALQKAYGITPLITPQGLNLHFN